MSEPEQELPKNGIFFKRVKRWKLKFRYKLIILLLLLLVIFFSYEEILTSVSYFLVKEDKQFEFADALLVEEDFANKNALDFCHNLFKEGKCKEIFMVKVINKSSIYSDRQYEYLLKKTIDSLYYNMPLTFINLDIEHPITLNKSRIIIDTLNSRNFKKIILVTSGFHSKRSFLTYKKYFKDTDIKLSVFVYYSNYTPNNWWKNIEGFREVITEYLKLVYYWLRGLL
jgi:hypothetical protein